MKKSGIFFEPSSSKYENGEIKFNKKNASIISNNKIICNKILIETIQNKKDIYLKNGYMFSLRIPLTNEEESYLSNKRKIFILWLEQFSFARAMILSGLLISFVILFRYFYSITTPLIISSFPKSWEKTIGNNIYVSLKKTIFKNTELSKDTIIRLRKKSHKIAKANGFNPPKILFHQSSLIGANALAFPGGPVVLTDDLVKLLGNDNLILGVIAHEFVHVQKQHSLKQIIEIIGIATLSSIILGSNETLIEEASFIGINLWASKKSRDFEKEADLLALKYLENANIDKSSLGLALKKLIIHFCNSSKNKNTENCFKDSKHGWFSSHPSGEERLKYLRE